MICVLVSVIYGYCDWKLKISDMVNVDRSDIKQLLQRTILLFIQVFLVGFFCHVAIIIHTCVCIPCKRLFTKVFGTIIDIVYVFQKIKERN